MNAPDSNSLTFPVKLKRIVDAPETDHLIYWDEDGLSFHIVDENQLARDVIPNYFKHNNISSFIRQLNMYGFHKINRIENGLAVIGSGKDDSQWSHPLFIREKPELLQNITRKVTNGSFNYAVSTRKPNSNENEIVPYDSVRNDIAHLAKAVQHLKHRDEETSEKLKTLQEENHQLYSVLMYLREEHDKQSKLIDILIKFFSLYANNPQESRLKSKRLFAIELPKSNSSISNLIEQQPPRKYLVTSQSDSPKGSLSDDMSNSFKGKKVIKITPKSITNHNRICRIPSDPKPSQIYSITIPKTKNNVIIPSRAITSSQSTTSKPTFIIPNLKPKQQIITSNSANNPFIAKKSIAKTVTVSSIDNGQDDKIYDTQYLNFPKTDLSSAITNNKFSNSEQLQCDFNIEDFLDLSTKSNAESLSSSIGYRDHNIFQQNSLLKNESIEEQNVSNMISCRDISANVNSVGKSLSEIKRCFTVDNDYPINNTSTSLAGNDMNFDIELDGMIENINTADDELSMLWKNIYSGSPDYSTGASDPDKIQGHELIPFNNTVQQHSNEWQEPIYNYQDNFSIDDLLQTPEVHREDSTLLIDHNDFFNDSSKP